MNENNTKIIMWAGLSFLLSIVFIVFNNSSLVLGSGFFTKTLAIIVGTISGAIIALICSSIFSKITHQLIGLFVGVVLGSAIVLMVLSNEVKGEFIAGCISSYGEKGTCSCMYDELNDKYDFRNERQILQILGRQSESFVQDMFEAKNSCS